MDGQYPPEGYNPGYGAPAEQSQFYPSQGYEQPYPDPGGVGGYSTDMSFGGGYSESFDSSGTGDSALMIELAEQVFAERMRKVQKQMDELNELKTLMQVRLDSVASSVERIERIINSLQTSVLDKVGSYGSSLDSIKREMNMMQEGFSKTLPELVRRKKPETN